VTQSGPSCWRLFDMRFLSICVVLLALTPSYVCADSVASDADDWFKNEYAPLWSVDPWSSLSEIAGFYNEIITIHLPGGRLPVVTSRLWLSQSFDNWKLSGWVGSALAGYQSDQLNPSTALIKAKWKDDFSDGSEEFSCGWYLADLVQDRWLFTEYAEIDCLEHEL